MNRREFLIGSAALTGTAIAEEKTTDGGFAEVSWAEREASEIPRLPAGTGGIERFAKRCIGCHLCVAACPSKTLRPSTKLSRLGKVELDFRYGYCRTDCNVCGKVCPVNAIEKVELKDKRDVHTGRAVWSKERCLRTTVGEECHACEKHCPVKAIKLVNGFPVVDANACIGCGACEHYCPARPLTAIKVVGYERHRVVRPIAEIDLVAEMKSLIARGKTLVIAKDGVIVYTSEDRMIAPVKSVIAEQGDLLRGAIVADKVIGKAAAKLHAGAGVRKIITPLIAEPAKRWLEARGIAVEADEVVPKILNRDRTGECPLDAKTEL